MEQFENENSVLPTAAGAGGLSPEVREIISYKPVWIIRNGNMLFLGIMMLMIAVSFVVKYPDVVQARALLTSINAPKEVKVKTGGLLMQLKVKEEQQVSANQILGFLESTADPVSVLMLDSLTKNMEFDLEKGNVAGAVSVFSKYDNESNSLGELSPSFVSFSAAYRQFKQYLSTGYFLHKRTMLSEDISFLSRLRQYLVQQKTLQTEDLDLQKLTLEANRYLDSNKVISAAEFRNEQSKFIGKSLTIPQINSAIVNNENTAHEKEKEIAQLDNEIAQQKEIFRQALQTLQSAVAEWKNKYVFIAPIAGKIRFTGFVQEKQQVQTGQTICFVDPGNSEYYAQISIPQNNFGKIETGQKVKLKFPSYPYQEFGALEGKLGSVNKIPTDSGFVAKVDLPKGLVTNYKKEISYHAGLSATAEIVTANTSLAQRIFNQLISVIRN